MTITSEFGAAVKAMRIARGLTQRELADLAGMNREHVAEIEAGRWASIKDASAEKLSKALRCKVTVLLEKNSK